MNEYTYEIWSKYISSLNTEDYEFYELCTCKAADANEALKIANDNKNSKSKFVSYKFLYQVRNLKKI